MNSLLAATSGSQDLKAIITAVYGILQTVVPLIVGLALVYFLWGVTKYIKNGGNEKEATAARDMMIYGVIGIFVMVSLWGILAIITGTFFGSTSTTSQTSVSQFVQTIQSNSGQPNTSTTP